MTDVVPYQAPRAPATGVQVGLSIGEIVAIMFQRRTADTILIRQMIDIRDRYNGDLVLPFQDVQNNPVMKPPVANLIAEAIDSLATKANSMMPRITAPPQDDTSETSRKQADTRRRALYGRWHTSQLELKLYRAYRHLTGYGTFAMVTMWDDVREHAVVELRDPLLAYPELRAPDDVREPRNVGFIFSRSVDWIHKHFPVSSRPFMENAAGKNWDVLWDLVEWIDEESIVIGIMGPKQPAYGAQEARSYAYTAYELDRWDNKAGIVPVICPRRVTLDRIQGQMSGLIEMTDLFGRVTALDIIAMERAIFPDMVIISKTGGPPQLYSGDWHDGRSGKVNLLSDAVAQVLESSPGPGGAQIIANMETALRSTGGATGPNQAQGMRTGAGVDALAQFSVNPRMQEAQAIVARSLSSVNDHIQAVEKGYGGDQKMWVIPGLRNDMKGVEYVPNRDFAFTHTVVDYPYAGMDTAELSVAVAQLVGTKLASRKSARSMHPMIDDGTEEDSQVTIEALDDAQLAGIQTQLQQGSLPLPVAAHIRQLVLQGRGLSEAIIEATAIVNNGAPPPGAPGAPQLGPDGQPVPGPDGQPDQGQLSPATTGMMQAIGAPPGNEATIPPPTGGLSNNQKLVRAINAQISPSAT